MLSSVARSLFVGSLSWDGTEESTSAGDDEAILVHQAFSATRSDASPVALTVPVRVRVSVLPALNLAAEVELSITQRR